MAICYSPVVLLNCMIYSTFKVSSRFSIFPFPYPAWSLFSLQLWCLLNIVILKLILYSHSSQFEEKFEEISGAEPPSSLPSTASYNEQTTATEENESRGNEIEMQEHETQRLYPDANSQDFVSGIMKIVPEVDVSLIFELIFCMGK